MPLGGITKATGHAGWTCYLVQFLSMILTYEKILTPSQIATFVKVLRINTLNLMTLTMSLYTSKQACIVIKKRGFKKRY